MYFVISPAKSLDFEQAALVDDFSQPEFLKEASELIEVMRGYDVPALKTLMGVSDKIAELNVERFRDWSAPFDLSNAKQAVYAFTGDVYTGLSMTTAGQKEIDYLQAHARILSGLYGILRPLDLIQPYRLEMGTKLENDRGANLYQFWGHGPTSQLADDLAAEGESVLVNLASNEYFKVLKKKELGARIVTPIFKDEKNGQYKMISFYAKKARGMMLRYAADYQVSDVEELKRFNYGGYQYNESLSKADEWCFTRDEGVDG